MSVIARDNPPADQPFQNAAPEFEFPFLNNGDSQSIFITRYLSQTVSGYIADRAAARFLPGVAQDSEYPGLYLLSESAARRTETAMVKFSRTFGRVPSQQITPSGYLFSAPSFPLVSWVSGTVAVSGQYALAGGYAVLSAASWLNGTPGVASVAAANGYYDVLRAITAYGSGTITVPGHNCVIGDVVIYVQISGNYNYTLFTVTNVSGDILTGTSTIFAAQIGAPDNLYGLVLPGSDVARKRTRASLDSGQTYNLTARVVENYYLPGVTAGIATPSDITPQGPFELANYLAAWATGPTSWFNVQASVIKQHLGPLLVQSYTQANLSGVQ